MGIGMKCEMSGLFVKPRVKRDFSVFLVFGNLKLRGAHLSDHQETDDAVRHVFRAAEVSMGTLSAARV